MYRFLGFVGILIIGISLWWGFVVVPQSRSSNTEEENAFATTTDSTVQWQWQFDPMGEADGVPKTNVTLNNGGTSYVIGTMDGSCFDILQSEWTLLSDEGEFAGAICWWAGGGKEIGVFSDGGRALIRVGEIDEGTAEGGGSRGNFQTLFAIDFGFIRSLDTASSTLQFDDAQWMTGTPGEDAAIAAGLCTEETRSECLPNDFYIGNPDTAPVTIPLAPNLTVYMLTWNAGDAGIKRQSIRTSEFAALINDASLHWNKLPYNVTVKNNAVIMIEEVYVP
jgi:hypothetical protein